MTPTPNLSQILGPIDWFFFGLIALLTLLSILYGQRQKKKASTEAESMLDILVMGRKLTLPLFTATLVATWYGGIFGVTEIAFNQGIVNFLTQGIFWYITYILFALFLVDRITKYQAVTLADLVEKMIGPKSAKLAGIFNFFNVLPIAYTISLGILIQSFTGLGITLSMSIGVGIVVLYSFSGGLRAVVYSDLIQFFSMCLGVFLVLVFSIKNYGGPYELYKALPAKYFSPTGGQSMWQIWVWGLIALSTLVDPNFYQRCFAAKSPKVAKRGILLSTVIWCLFDICTTLGAMYAKMAIPAAESNKAYLFYSLQVLPDGMKGVFLAGIMATILSTLDSYLFLAGATLSYDLSPKKYKGKPWAFHLGVISVAILSVVLALHFQGDIKTAWKTLGSYSASCLLFPFLFRQLSKRPLSDRRFVAASLIGVVTTTYWRLAPHQGLFADIDEIYIGILSTSFVLLWPKKAH